MKDSRPIGTPMSTRHKLSKNDDFKEVDQITYRSMIGKLQYVVHTKLDIALTFGTVGRFLRNPTENNMNHEITKRYSRIWFMVQNRRQFIFTNIQRC